MRMKFNSIQTLILKSERSRNQKGNRNRRIKPEPRKLYWQREIGIRLDIRVSGVDIKERRMVRTKGIRNEWTVWRLGMVYGVWCMINASERGA